MDLRQLAERDLSKTIEADGQEFIFTNHNGVDYTVKGIVNDIGYVLDEMGQEVASRRIVATWRLSHLITDGKYILPDNGWKVTYKDLLGNNVEGYITQVEPDRQLGIGKVYLSLDLS